MPAVGRRDPRLYTPPLRKLTRRTSKGFEVIDFATNVLRVNLMPWQKWLLVHGLELLPDGQYRWRTVIVLVSRQNGKTLVLGVLALWRLLLDDARLVLGTSTNLDYAKEAWQSAVDLAEAAPEAAPEFRWPPRFTNGQETITTVAGARYKIAAANKRGGRSLSVDLGIADELREHANWDAWAALSGTTTARPDPQLWALSNAGDDTSIVLNHFRDGAVAGLEAGEDPGDVALFEWSAPEGCELDDHKAWQQANPGLGHTITQATLAGKLRLPPAVFRTEHLCQRVISLDAAIDIGAWQSCHDDGTLDAVRDRVALCLDVAPDLTHVTLVAAAALDDGRVRTEVVESWESTDDARRDLPALLARIKPRVFGWFPGGPAASLAADLRGQRDHIEIKADTPAVCQGLAEQVTARRILQNGDPLLTAQVTGVSKLYAGDGWRFARRGAGHADAVYAAAGAVHLARTLPAPRPRPLVIVGRRPAA